MSFAFNRGKSADVYLKEKAISCMFFDHCIEPRVSEEEANRYECAEMLREFLEKVGITFDEFYDYVHLHSYGHGSDYLQDLNDMNKADEAVSDDNYTDF